MKKFSEKYNSALLKTRPILTPGKSVLEEFNTERILFPYFQEKDIGTIKEAQERYNHLTSEGSSKFYQTLTNQLTKSQSTGRLSRNFSKENKSEINPNMTELERQAILFRDRHKDMLDLTLVTLNRKNTVIHPKLFEQMGTMCISELWSVQEKSKIMEAQKEYHQHQKVRHSIANMYLLRLHSRNHQRNKNFFKEKRDISLTDRIKNETTELINTIRRKPHYIKLESHIRDNNETPDIEIPVDRSVQIGETTSDFKINSTRINSHQDSMRSSLPKIPRLDFRSQSINYDENPPDDSSLHSPTLLKTKTQLKPIEKVKTSMER